MNKLTLLVLLIPLWHCAQELSDSTIDRRQNRHWTIDLAAGVHMQNALHGGLDGQLTYRHTKWTFIAQSFNSLPKQFDTPRKELDRYFHHYQPENGMRSLSYNQSSLVAVRQLTASRAEKTTRRGNVVKRQSTGIRAGYYYTQRSLYNSSDPNYNQVDTTATSSAIFISGFQTHAASIGLDVLLQRYGRRVLIEQHIYSDLLIGINLHYTGFTQSVSNDFRSTTINDHFQRNYLGIRTGYEWRFYCSNRFGFLLAAEAQWKPSIDYIPNRAFWVPRGGERIYPFTEVIKCGVTYWL